MSRDPIRILHITDPHLFAEADGSLRGTVTAASLEAVLEDVDRRQWPADLVAMTGDLIQDDTAAAYERFADLLRPLGLPVHCVPGNHDVRHLMQDALRDAPFHYCAAIELGPWLIVGIDSCIAGEAGGRVSDAELKRLKKVLAASEKAHAVVCLHHPPVRVGSRWLDSVGLHNADEFLAAIAGYGKVRATISGHVHQALCEEIEGITVIATPSTCRQFKPKSDEFALDDRPPGYRHVTLHADGRIESELIWLADDE